MPQFIYTMKGLGKVYPPDAVVLKDIWLSFYYGAKIGVLGSNGAGKSSLLRIMAGVDRDFAGEERSWPQERRWLSSRSRSSIPERRLATSKKAS
jgi:ATPase subunit of ABC transporter with duplicated ATPase domains